MNACLYTESHGSGPDLVLWHGWGMNLRAFDPLVDALALQYRVTTVDLPGHGRSDALVNSDFRAALPALLAALPDRCVLAGWSLGGLLAMQAACQLPERIHALILLHSTPKFVADADWHHGIDGQLLQAFGRSLAESPERALADFVALQLRGSRDAARVADALLEALHAHGQATPAALAAGLEFLRCADLRAVAMQLVLPTLIVAGQHDRVTPPAAARALGAMMPGARVTELPRCGHVSFLTHTPAVAALCREWLSTHLSSRALA